MSETQAPLSVAINAVQNSFLFADLPPDAITLLAGIMQTKRWPAGEVVLKQGRRGSSLYLILSGEAQVILQDLYQREVVLAEVGPGQSIGAPTFVSTGRHRATVMSKTALVCLRLERNQFLALAQKHPIFDLETIGQKAADMAKKYALENLQKHPMFQALPPAIVAQLYEKLQKHRYKPGEFLMHKGDPGTRLYIMGTGWVNVVSEDPDVPDNQELVLNQCGPGETLGEMALLDGEPHSAGVVTLTEVELYTLNREDFYAILRNHSDMAIDMLRTVITRLRFATTYIETATQLSEHIAAGQYDVAITQLHDAQSEVVHTAKSGEEKAQALIASFAKMIHDVKAREENLKKQVYALRIEIDQAKREKQVSAVLEESSFENIKSAAKAFRRRKTKEKPSDKDK